MAQWSGHWTRNPVVLGRSPAPATWWICSRSYRVQILSCACKLFSQLVTSSQLGFLILLSCI